MTFVTTAPALFGAAGLGALLTVAGCTEPGGTTGAATPSTATAEIAVPAPAPLPPPPKPAVRQTRPAPKAAAKPTNGSEQHATNGAAATEKSSDMAASVADVPRPAEPPAVESAEQQLALRSPGGRAPIRLIGLNRNATTALLGAPAEERQVAVARVWDYRGPDCRLAVYFYLDTGRNDFYALHYEIDGPEAGPDAEQHCLQRIRDARGN